MVSGGQPSLLGSPTLLLQLSTNGGASGEGPRSILSSVGYSNVPTKLFKVGFWTWFIGVTPVSLVRFFTWLASFRNAETMLGVCLSLAAHDPVV